MPFNQLTGATIDVFAASDGTSQVGSTINVPSCTQPVGSTTAGCFDPGLAIGNFVGAAAPAASTTLAAATLANATSFTVASGTNFVPFEMVTVGVGTASSETVEITAVAGTTITIPKLSKAHAAGDAVVTSFRAPKFYGYSLNLPGAADPGQDYWITIKYFNGGTQLGVANLINVKVISGKVNSLTVSAANTYTSANGVVIASSTGFGTYLGLGATQAMTVNAVDPSGGTLTYAWTAVASSGTTTCAGYSFDNTNTASVNFTAPAAASGCKVQVVVTSSNAIPTAAKVTTFSVANDVTITPGAAPPQINQIVISSNNAADAVCTLQRATAPCTGNACWPIVSCPLAFARPAAPSNPANVYAAQSYFVNVAVSANLGGEEFNPSAPPAATATIDCPNDTIDFPYDSKGKPTKSISFPAGYIASGTVNGNVNEWGTDSYFQEPSFTFGEGAWDDGVTYALSDLVVAYGSIYGSASAGNLANDPAEGGWNWVSSASAIPLAYQTAWTANGTSGMCTVSVKVTNQSGGADIVPVGVYFQ